jgi:glucokinase
VIALDVGGTSVRGALVDRSGQFLRQCRRPSGGVPGAADPGLGVTAQVAEELLDLARDTAVHVSAIGAGFPEYVHQGRLTSSEVLAWRKQPLEVLADLAPGLAIGIESDVRCGALAEFAAIHRGAPGASESDIALPPDASDPRRYRDRSGASSLYYVSWGTGLSGTLVLDGRCITGARGEAIALGELPYPAGEQADGATTLETFASGAGMAARYCRAIGAPVDGASALFDAAAAGDPEASRIVQSAGRAVGAAIGGIVALLDPGAVIIGGGIGAGPGLRIKGLTAAYRAATGRRPGAPGPTPARLGPRSGLVGAAMVATRAGAGLAN